LSNPFNNYKVGSSKNAQLTTSKEQERFWEANS